MIFEYFTFHNFSDSFKFITAVLVSLVLASRTTYDLLPFKLVPDIHLSFWGYFLVKCFAIVILLRILSQTEFPFRAIENLVSSVRDRFTRNESEYPGFRLKVLGCPDHNRVSKQGLRHFFGLSGSREVQQKPLMVFTIHNLMKQISYQQIPVCFLYKVQSEYFLLYAFRLMRFLKFYFDSFLCHPDCLAILNRRTNGHVQYEADRDKSPFQLLFSCLERGLALTQNQYERSELGDSAFDRDLALLRYFLTRTFVFHRLSWVDNHFDLTTLACRAWDKANLYYAKVREVSLDLGAERLTPWLGRVIRALFTMSECEIQFTYREGNTEYVIYRNLEPQDQD